MRNEAEFVTVLGHEIGHVTARHSVAMMSRAQLAQIGLGVGSIISPALAPFGDLAAGGLQLLFLSYGRDAERQADDLGYRYALAQNFDVREMVNVFAALQSSADLAGQSPIPTWLASHPYPAERIVRIEKRLASLPASAQPRRVGEDDFLQQIDGLMYGENPRNGYFESNRFYHPGLAFRLDCRRAGRRRTSPAGCRGQPREGRGDPVEAGIGYATGGRRRIFRPAGRHRWAHREAEDQWSRRRCRRLPGADRNRASWVASWVS